MANRNPALQLTTSIGAGATFLLGAANANALSADPLWQRAPMLTACIALPLLLTGARAPKDHSSAAVIFWCAALAVAPTAVWASARADALNRATGAIQNVAPPEQIPLCEQEQSRLDGQRRVAACLAGISLAPLICISVQVRAAPRRRVSVALAFAGVVFALVGIFAGWDSFVLPCPG